MSKEDEVRQDSMIDRSDTNGMDGCQGGESPQNRKDRSLARSSTWKPQPMEQYRHFKGGRYQVLCVAEKEDTGEKMVIYQALYGVGKIWARTLRDFASEVDRTRYPEARQKFRFEKIDPLGESAAAESQKRNSREDLHSSYHGNHGEHSDGNQNGRDSLDSFAAEGSVNEYPAAGRLGAEPQETPEKTDADPYAAGKNADVGQGSTLNPLVEEFLDAESAEDKLAVLAKMRSIVTDDMIDTMAMAAGVEIDPGPVETRYYDLRDCLLMIDRYEMERERLRN